MPNAPTPQTYMEDVMASMSAISELLVPMTMRMLQSSQYRPCREELADLDELTERVAVMHATVRTMNENHVALLEILDCSPAQLWKWAKQLRQVTGE